ncbi:MAG: hypothetical protein KAG26_08590, partial [Methylococcales bacterium]|nr:hypothetical protein [Methylococcales bacterium]
MMTNKELQKLFQGKLKERKVDFNPDAWTNMDRLLDSKMPVRPWYIPFSKWVKGFTAAIVVGFSLFSIGIQPYQDSQTENTDNVNGVSSVKEVNDSSSEPILENSNANTNAFSIDDNTASANTFSHTNGNKQQENLTGDKPKKKTKRNKKKSKKAVKAPQSRFVDEETIALKEKDFPQLTFDYVEPSLANSNPGKGEVAATSPPRKPPKRNKSPLKVAATFSAITAKNLLPESEGSLNTSFKPGFSIGLNLTQPLSAKIGISGAVNYKWQKAEGTSSTYEKSYSFGPEETYTVLNYKSLHNLDIPIEFFYRLNEK